MLASIIFLILGLVLILWGANAMTDGASAIAKRLGVSDLVIGLTVVAFGTSAPELVISVLSSVQGSAEMAIGNVVGSNIFNILVIVGVTAMVSPIKVERSIMTNEIPLVLLSSLALLVIGLSPVLDDGASRIVSRCDGLLLLMFFAIFMRYVFSQASSGKDDGDNADGQKVKEMGLVKAIILVVLGLAALVFGGDRFVSGASGIASSLGVSDAIIGLTIVAAGTSLPELATSIVSAMKGRTGLAVGNVVGSCIFNVFLVLGASSVVRELPFGNISDIDLYVLVGSSALFLLFGWLFGKRTFTRAEGAFMLACYIGYTAYLISVQ